MGSSIPRASDVEGVDKAPPGRTDVHDPARPGGEAEPLDRVGDGWCSTGDGHGVTNEELRLQRHHQNAGGGRREVWGGKRVKTKAKNGPKLHVLEVGMEKMEKIERNHTVFPKIPTFGSLKMILEVPPRQGDFGEVGLGLV